MAALLASACSEGPAEVSVAAAVVEPPPESVAMSAEEQAFFAALCIREAVVVHHSIEEMAADSHSVVLGRVTAVRPGPSSAELEITIDHHVAGADLGERVVLAHPPTADPGPVPSGRVMAFVKAAESGYRVIEPAGLLYEPPGGGLAPPLPALICPGELELGLYAEIAADISTRTVADVLDLLRA